MMGNRSWWEGEQPSGKTFVTVTAADIESGRVKLRKTNSPNTAIEYIKSLRKNMNIREYISNTCMNVSVDDPAMLDLEIVAVEPAKAELVDRGIFSIIQVPDGNYLHLRLDEKASNDWQRHLESCLRMGSSRRDVEWSQGSRPLRSLKIIVPTVTE